ncbi:MAG: shikimate kinase [Flavobacteriales bacterium]
MIITLIGYMGSGKSFIGKQLAHQLSFPFIDLDFYIEEKEKKSIASLFKEKGEIYFRKSEHYALLEILKNPSNCILSLGGGTPCFYDNMKHINQNSISFYLKNSISTLSTRLQIEKEHRPIISHLKDEQIPEFIAKHLFERRFFYEKATYTLEVDQQPLEKTLDFIQSVYKEKMG